MKYICVYLLIFFSIVEITNGQNRCDTVNDFIFTITEFQPVPSQSINDIEKNLNRLITINNQTPRDHEEIVLSFIINCKGEDFSYRIFNSFGENIDNQIIDYFSKNVSWAPARMKYRQEYKEVDFNISMRIRIDNNNLIIDYREPRTRRNRRR